MPRQPSWKLTTSFVLRASYSKLALDEFLSYLHFLDQYLEAETTKSRIELEDLLAKLKVIDPDEADSLVYHNWKLEAVEEQLQHHKSLSNRHYQSFLVSLYSYLESALMHRCYLLQEWYDSKLAVKDLAGTGIDQAVKYLIKAHEVPITLGDSQTWSEIQKIRSIRNYIVHNLGRVDNPVDQKSSLSVYISKKGLTLDPIDHRIILTRQFCEEAIAVVRQFLSYVDGAIDEREKQVNA